MCLWEAKAPVDRQLWCHARTGGTSRAVPVSHIRFSRRDRWPNPICTRTPTSLLGREVPLVCHSRDTSVFDTQKGTSRQSEPREEAAAPPKLRSTASSQGFLQKAGSACLEFFIIIQAHYQQTAIFHNEITTFISNFSLKLCHFGTASYYAARRCASEPQHWWLAAELMEIARMHLTDSLTSFVKSKSTHMPKGGW